MIDGSSLKGELAKNIFDLATNPVKDSFNVRLITTLTYAEFMEKECEFWRDRSNRKTDVMANFLFIIIVLICIAGGEAVFIGQHWSKL